MQHITTWASFNWDCVFEASFWYSSGPYAARIDPHLPIQMEGWGNFGEDPKHTFLKLHGGINWWFANGEISYLRFGSQELDSRWAVYEGGKAAGEPVILEPSFYKYSGAIYDLVKPQWLKFAAAIADADLVIII